MGGGGGTKSTSTSNVPSEFSPLYANTARQVSEYQNVNPILGFAGANPRSVPGQSQGQRYASMLTQGIGNAPSTEQYTRDSIAAGQGWGGAKVTGANVGSDPAIAAAREAFRSGAAKNIIDQQTLSGRGRMNSVDNALANAEAQFMLPVIQESLNREERGIDRGMGASFQGAQLMGLQGEREMQRRLAALNSGLTVGEMERGVAKEQEGASYEDYLRRQGLAEQATFGPLGQIPSTFGQTVKSTGGK